MSKQKKANPCLTCEFRIEAQEKNSRYDKIIDAILSAPLRNEDLKLADMRQDADQGRLFDVLKGYLDSFDGISRRLEATYNLMRYLRREAIELQPKTQEATA